MALTIGTATTGAPVTTFDAAGSDMMVVGVINATSSTVLTFNSKTLVTAVQYDDGTRGVGIYYVLAPGSGSHSIAVSGGGTPVYAITVSGSIDLVTPIGTTYANGGSNPDKTISPTAAVWTVFTCNNFRNSSSTAVTCVRGTEIYNDGPGTGVGTGSYLSGTGPTARLTWSDAHISELYLSLVEVRSTETIAPIMTTEAVTAYTRTTATGNGTITSTGGANLDERGFVWSTTSHADPGNAAPGSTAYESHETEGGTFSSAGSFTGAFTSLIPNTTYYARSYGHNTNGYAYGSEVSFTTFPNTFPNLDNIGLSDGSDDTGGTKPFDFTNAGNLLCCAIYLANTSVSIIDAQFNGASFTNLYTDNTSQTLWVGYIKNPTLGTHAFNFTFSPSVAISFRVVLVSFLAASQSPIGGTAHGTVTGTTTPISDTVTVQGKRGVVLDFLFVATVDSATPYSPQLAVANITGGWNSGGGSYVGAASLQSHTGSNTTAEWSMAGLAAGSKQEHYAVELLPNEFVPQMQIL